MLSGTFNNIPPVIPSGSTGGRDQRTGRKKYNDIKEVTDKLILKCIKHTMDRMVHVLPVVSDCEEYMQIQQPRFRTIPFRNDNK
jgi:hypothetical protein